MVDDTTGDPNRHYNRVHFETVLVLDCGGERLTYQRTHDISMNGVFVSTSQPLPTGEALFPFTMTLSVGMRKEIIKGQCQVVRSISIDEGLTEEDPGPGMGLKFVNLEDESSVMLYQIIKHNQPGP